jgi:superfamily II DNA or RNA helicase
VRVSRQGSSIRFEKVSGIPRAGFQNLASFHWALKTLYPVQQTHVDRLWSILFRHGSALDSSETGCGKTVCAAEIAKRHGGPVRVICPKAVIPSWCREFTDRQVVAEIANYEKIRTGKTYWGFWTPRGKQWVWTFPKNTLIIFDEAHRCGGIGTQNSKMLLEAKDRYKVLMLSATIASSPLQMRAAGYVLGLHGLGNFYAWAQKYGAKKNRWNGFDFSGDEKAIAELGASMSPRVSRMTVADLKDHFAETQINTEPLNFGEEIQRIYREMEDELEELAEKAKDDPKGAAANALTTQLRARQRAELLKVPVIAEMVEDYLAEGKSIAVFVNFTQTLQALGDKLNKVPWGKIDGCQTGTERENVIQAFQNDTFRLVLSNTAAGGVGVSLHDITGKHPRVAIISPDWNEKSIIQAVGRVHRAGGKTPSQQRILFAAGTIEEQVEKSVRKKIRNLETLNEKSACLESETSYKLSPPTHQTTNIQMPANTKTNDTPDHSARIHAEHSPSALKNYEACPSYKKREGSNAIADQGTKIHEAIDSGDTSLLNDEEKAIAQYCFDFQDHIRRSKGVAPVKELREVVLDIVAGDQATFGSADLIEIYGDGTAVLMDWKTGYGAVDDAEVNSQVWAYTLGLFQAHPEVHTVDAYLVLPRRQEISSATFKRADADKLALRINTIISRAKEVAGVEFNPTEGVCDYCAFKGSCKALAGKALILGQKAGFDVPANISLDGSPEDRAKLLKLANILSEWCDATKKELLRQALEEGAEIPGYRLDQRKTPRTIDNPVAGYEALKSMVNLEEFLSAASRISVPTLEKIVSEKAPKGEKAKAKEALEDALRDANALKEEGVIHVLKALKA